MNGLKDMAPGTDGRSRCGSAAGSGGLAQDDQALTRRLRALGVRLRVDGRAVLRLGSGLERSLRRLNAESVQACRDCERAAEDLERLCEDARLMEACARQARAEEGTSRLPACGGTPRILLAMRALAAGGDVRITRDRFLLAVATIDDVQALTMAELWSAAAALRVALLEGFAVAARSVLEAAEERRAAEAWLDGRCEAAGLAGRGAAFFARALQLAAEEELPDVRAQLEACLSRADMTCAQCVQAAQEAQALDKLRLDNLIGAVRMLEALDGQEFFSRLSRTDAELRGDPAEIYPQMEEASRAAVRREVEVIARRLRLGEQAVAHQAVLAARAALESEGADSVRGTVCWWLYNDAGRKAFLARLGLAGRLPKLIPDPRGRLLLGGQALLCLMLLAAVLGAGGSALFLLPGLPLAWQGAGLLLGRLVPLLVRPRPLLKLELERLEARRRTLVVIPALLSSEARAAALCAQMETLGCLERDPDVDFLLLGDFRDGDAARAVDDGAIMRTVRERLAALNRAAGREKYAFLQRDREYVPVDGIWRGHERKRGALMALNALLLGRTNAENAFAAEAGAAPGLAARRYAYVVTLDADTSMLPGTIHRLVGTLDHPLNRLRVEDGRRAGYAILQPNMELRASAGVNRFVRVFAGRGGVDGYPVSVSSLHQDLTGRGIYGGKGIYDLGAFHEALDGALPDGCVLSHDLLEGLLAEAGFVNDISFYDGFPATPDAFLRRLERWTRGDWQLLPFLLKRRPFAVPARLDALDRFKLLDNLLRSLAEPALLALLLLSAWLGRVPALALGAIFSFLPPLLALPRTSREDWRRAAARLAILPALCLAQLGGTLRGLWRRLVSGRRLLDWVTAADAEGAEGRGGQVAAVAAALLLLPGLAHPGWTLPVLALAVLFCLGPAWMRELGRTDVETAPALTLGQIGALTETARDTWRFFEFYVPLEGTGLPPDNVQIDPPVGAAPRTSPTNIGLYMLSCYAAQALGFLRREELLVRLERTVETLESLEKWRGQLYNWYDTETLAPLKPRYVSAVDSGNLAACLLLLAQALGDDPLSGRLKALARAMELNALYDPARKLFYIGFDVENERRSEAHYDLLASEARILSYTAMMLGQVPPEHWRHLARPVVRTGGGQALVSWSGTLFEYLMPRLLLRAPEGTLLDGSSRAAVAAQQAAGAAQGRPWGVSESGCYAFDAQLNYQYRAFGLRELALSGAARENVVAPYASMLALSVDPVGAAENIIRMRRLGWVGERGFYEAADYTAGENAPRLVASHMAHHQGMALCALANALVGDVLVKEFAAIPEARALSLLLEEKPAARIRLSRRMALPRAVFSPRPSPGAECARAARPGQRLADAHVLAGAGAMALVTARGDGFYRKNGIQANVFTGDLLGRREGVFLHARLEGGGEKTFGGPDTKVLFRAGSARYSLRLGEIELRLVVSVSPEDGTLFHHIEAENHGTARAALVLTDCLAVALAGEAEMRAHPAFQKLFVESSFSGGALRFVRRTRRPSEETPVLLHLASGGELLGWETDLDKLLGRSGELSMPETLPKALGGTLGATLDPCSALRIRLELEAGGKRSAHFALGFAGAGAEDAWTARNILESAPERSCQLAETRALAQLDFIGLDGPGHRLLQRASAFLADAHLAPRAARTACAGGADAKRLWGLGISGDLPVISVHIAEAAQLTNAREAIRAHEFYRGLGLWCDLVFVNEYSGDYAQPLREALRDLIDVSHLRDLNDRDGGVRVFEGGQLSAEQRRLLDRAAVLRIAGREDFHAQLRERLKALEAPRTQEYPVPMPAPQSPPAEAANGFGAFSGDGSAYRLRIGPGRETPAPWSNVLVGEGFGALLTERGGGFFWRENSRNQRLTPFANDALDEGWGLMLCLVDVERRQFVRLLPGKRPGLMYTVTHGAGFSRYESAAGGLESDVELYVHPRETALLARIELRNPGAAARRLELTAFADWLMGVDALDLVRLRAWNEDGVCFATGSMPGVAYLAAPGEAAAAGGTRQDFLGVGGLDAPAGLAGPLPEAGGSALRLGLELPPGAARTVRLRLGWAEDLEQARRLSRAPVPARVEDRRFAALRFETPDGELNDLLNHFLPRQVLDGRVLGRCGLYQPGGAFGFRDQLQDMLALLPYDPERVRAHLITCAARQFLEGDVLHWWHAPGTGVRTRISDDLLFLPYVCACYVRETGDASILGEAVPFLQDMPLPEDREDVYGETEGSNVRASLHEHCMRAFRRAARTGGHGLALMGTGDWNDGMNRVGAQGRGESVWLSLFLSACARAYAEIAPREEDRAWLNALSARMNAACEEFGWDGAWYLRAWTDEGEKLGSRANEVCRIDLISQAWAVLAGLDAARCAQALDSAWDLLVDEERGIIKLLTPPFDGEVPDPGYIRGYPPGVRENGGQYTHAACWFALALARAGDTRAHRALRMLLPTSHARTEEAVRRYRVEPYVVAADIYGEAPHAGRGGWTWYTGAAAWLLRAVLEILGYERRGDRVRLRALLGDWPEAALTLRFGASSYRLVCRADASVVLLDGVPAEGDSVQMRDDGKRHEVVFPPRLPAEKVQEKERELQMERD